VRKEGESGEPGLSYRMRRGGPVGMVFIHGLGASKECFNACFELPYLKDYTLLSVDLPGCGDSPGQATFSCTMTDQALLIFDLLKHLGLTRIIIVGHSMGGVIGLYLAGLLGSGVEAFFNLEGQLSHEDTLFSRKITSLSMEVFERLGFEVFKKWLEEDMVEHPSPGLKGYLESLEKASPGAVYLSSLSLVRETRQGRLRERFLALPCRKWYVFGERSVNSSTEIFLRENKITYFIVPKSGHMMMSDQPARFQEMLLKALEKEGGSDLPG
jgi:haloalkane dehalogenase